MVLYAPCVLRSCVGLRSKLAGVRVVTATTQVVAGAIGRRAANVIRIVVIVIETILLSRITCAENREDIVERPVGEFNSTCVN